MGVDVMRTLRQMVLGFGLAALMSVPAMAQGRGGFGGGFGGPALLANESVQKELKIEGEQKEKVTKFTTDLNEKRQSAFQGVAKEERQKKMAEFNAEAMKGVVELLKPEQLKRFNQIRFQQMGAAAFGDPDVAAKLKLTAEQKEKIQGINTDAQAQRRELMQGFQDDREGTLKKLAAFTKELTEKAVGVLTSEQKTTWKEILGAPFEIVIPQRAA
jgi:hypothetical protein